MQASPSRTLPDGRTVEAYPLANANGLSLQGITYGATVTSQRVPDRDGQLADVVLGFSNLEDYLAPHPYFGAIAGGVAERNSGARFVFDGCPLELASNDPPNHLQGGRGGFDRKLWSATPVSPFSRFLPTKIP